MGIYTDPPTTTGAVRIQELVSGPTASLNAEGAPCHVSVTAICESLVKIAGPGAMQISKWARQVGPENPCCQGPLEPTLAASEVNVGLAREYRLPVEYCVIVNRLAQPSSAFTNPSSS